MESEKKLIIIVDDNPANLRIGKNALSEMYRVATAPSAEKLFSLLESNYPALILLDVNMPDLDGYETIKKLKSNPETRNIPVIFLTVNSESDNELVGLSLGAVDYIIKPFNPDLLRKRIELHMLLDIQRRTLRAQASELQFFNDRLYSMVEEKTQDIQDLQNSLLKTIAELVECRDDMTGGHIDRTQRGVKILLAEIIKSGLFREETKDWNVDLLLQSCQLHDVGKISICDGILRKPGKLTNEEFEEMKKHVIFGEQIIERIELMTNKNDFLKYAKIFAASHHEKWDGTGYPYGLKRNEIPLLGRIMAVADVYDALISERPYKKAFSHEESVRIITEGRGTQFDPTLVDIFIQADIQFRNKDSFSMKDVHFGFDEEVAVEQVMTFD